MLKHQKWQHWPRQPVCRGTPAQWSFHVHHQYFVICKTRLLESTIALKLQIKFNLCYFTAASGSETARLSRDQIEQFIPELIWICNERAKWWQPIYLVRGFQSCVVPNKDIKRKYTESYINYAFFLFWCWGSATTFVRFLKYYVVKRSSCSKQIKQTQKSSIFEE